MASKKQNQEYKELMDAANAGLFPQHENTVHLDDKRRMVYATNGHIMHARAAEYAELNCLALLTCDGARSIHRLKDGSWTPAENRPNIETIIPSEDSLSHRPCVRMTIPSWIKDISKRAKNAHVSIILGETPCLALGEGYDNSVTFSAHYLKQFAGQEVDMYFGEGDGKTKHALTVLPAGTTLTSAPWFYMLMPVRASRADLPQNVTKNAA